MRLNLLKIIFFPSLCFLLFPLFTQAKSQNKVIYINDNGLVFRILTEQKSVKDLLLELNMTLNAKDLIFPDLNSVLGDQIFIQRAVPVLIMVDGKKEEYFTDQALVNEVLDENQIILKAEDKVNYLLNTPLFSNMEILITRVEKEIVKIEKEINFNLETKEDPELLFGKEKIVQEGAKGLKEEEYLVIYENNKEVKRTLQNSAILKEPQTKIIVLGAKIVKGRIEEGLASFVGKGISKYNGLVAAHKTWPRGTKVKVTNLNNQKTVIVKIIDRGPYIDGRVIDLSYEAFEQIANLGAGVTLVRIEEILE